MQEDLINKIFKIMQIHYYTFADKDGVQPTLSTYYDDDNLKHIKINFGYEIYDLIVQ